jgi:hypothetical protein
LGLGSEGFTFLLGYQPHSETDRDERLEGREGNGEHERKDWKQRDCRGLEEVRRRRREVATESIPTDSESCKKLK